MNFSLIRKENPLNEISVSLLSGALSSIIRRRGKVRRLSAPHGPTASVKVLSNSVSCGFSPVTSSFKSAIEWIHEKSENAFSDSILFRIKQAVRVSDYLQAHEGHRFSLSRSQPTLKTAYPSTFLPNWSILSFEPLLWPRRDNPWLILCEEIVANNPHQPEADSNMSKELAQWPLGEKQWKGFYWPTCFNQWHVSDLLAY